jgi:hypothetical protein
MNSLEKTTQTTRIILKVPALTEELIGVGIALP